jgi:hypothetical protein
MPVVQYIDRTQRTPPSWPMDDLEIEDVFADNRVYTFGKNECGQCGLGHTESPVYSPAPVPFFGGRNVVIVASGG